MSKFYRWIEWKQLQNEIFNFFNIFSYFFLLIGRFLYRDHKIFYCACVHLIVLDNSGFDIIILYVLFLDQINVGLFSEQLDKYLHIYIRYPVKRIENYVYIYGKWKKYVVDPAEDPME